MFVWCLQGVLQFQSRQWRNKAGTVRRYLKQGRATILSSGEGENFCWNDKTAQKAPEELQALLSTAFCQGRHEDPIAGSRSDAQVGVLGQSPRSSGVFTKLWTLERYIQPFLYFLNLIGTKQTTKITIWYFSHLTFLRLTTGQHWSWRGLGGEGKDGWW